MLNTTWVRILETQPSRIMENEETLVEGATVAGGGVVGTFSVRNSSKRHLNSGGISSSGLTGYRRPTPARLSEEDLIRITNETKKINAAKAAHKLYSSQTRYYFCHFLI